MAQLDACTADEQELVFQRLRENVGLHPIEEAWGCSSDVILTAIHKAPELTQRMLKGVVADAAFRMYVVPQLETTRWAPVEFATNELYDHKLADDKGPVTVQVKLQRSARGEAVRAGPRSRTWPPGYFLVEVQKTRTGKKKQAKNGTNEDGPSEEAVEVIDTRPYAFGDFDILAVSMWPSTRQWRDFRYTVGRWLIPRPDKPSNIAVMQPVSPDNNDVWTSDFNEAVKWLRSESQRSVKPVYQPATAKSKRKRKVSA